MRLKIVALSVVFSLLPSTLLLSQTKNTFNQFKANRNKTFGTYNKQRHNNFEEYRRQRNEAFAAELRKEWIRTEPSPVITKPKDEPVPPVVEPRKDTLTAVKPRPRPYDEVVVVSPPKPQPKPIDPIEEIAQPKEKTIEYTFYGTKAAVRFNKKNSFSLPTLNENSVADAWLKLSDDCYTNLVHDCIATRSSLELCDWAYLSMLEQMAGAVCGRGSNESVLLMAYVYCQTGYKMRLAIDGSKLYMLFASDYIIYDRTPYVVGQEIYYAYNNHTGSLKACGQKYPQEQGLRLQIDKEPLLADVATEASRHQSKKNALLSIDVCANKNRLDFYTSYPSSMIGDNFVSKWALYANMPMPQSIKNQVYPQIHKAIDGLDQISAINQILFFIQTGFKYEYDDKVWGGDRAFFPEESFYYPYCDCEDRSILLTRLVRDLMGLDCILVYYPGHLAAAVEITHGQPKGDYIEQDGHHYYIADGTILYGAPVGETMRNRDNQMATIILLK